MMDLLKKEHSEKKEAIKSKLSHFRNLGKDKYFEEFLFCTLTPQSNAQRCWSAVQEIIKLDQKNWNQERIARTIEFKTRFHNNKAKYIMNNLTIWKEIQQTVDNLTESNTKDMRNSIADKVNGYGLKEASHFLRNIGKSNNKIAILDRHILRNLKKLGVIETDQIRNNKHYLELEDKFLKFSEDIGIPIDELDLLFWSRENGEIFK